MAERLRAELKQNKPFANKAEEALLNVERTADCLRRELQHLLKPFGVTSTQYNALRILRGSLPKGLTCSELGQRLVSSDPDVTRLLDRLARQGLASRRRSCEDRRTVLTKISAEGLALLERVGPVLDDGIRRLAGHLSDQQLTQLIDLLEIVRFPLIQTSVRQEAAARDGGMLAATVSAD